MRHELVKYAKTEMNEITVSTTSKLNTLLQSVESVAKISVDLIDQQVISPTDYPTIASYTFDLLQSLNSSRMIYWALPNGDFIISRRLSEDVIETETIQRKKEAIEVATYRYGKGNKILYKNIKQTKSVDYDPRQRVWYKNSVKDKQLNWSNAYVFHTGEGKIIGITASMPLYNDQNELVGVFGIDVDLSTLSHFLSSLNINEVGVVFIIDENDRIIAHSKSLKTEATHQELVDINKVKYPWVKQSINEFKQRKESEFKYVSDNKTYLATYNEILPFKEYQWKIITIVPEDLFIGELVSALLKVCIIALVILIVGICFIGLSSSRISRSIKKLDTEMEKVKRFDLDTITPVNSYLKEIDSLNKTFIAMVYGLKMFKKYVPTYLVESVITQKKTINLGGDCHDITVFFSDISNFTNITETYPPEKIMTYLCAYYDVFAKIIMHNRGTIDKFIGDSVMAFWGSPLKDANKELHACHSAYQIREALKDNIHSQGNDNEILFKTRFGIHTGKAIVGNLGSSDRLNYTAIGDTINVGSRLESLNKFYQTEIIISEEVYKKVETEFYTRLLDKVAVKGKIQALFIYELIQPKSISILDEQFLKIQLYESAFHHYQNKEFTVAIAKLNDLLSQYDDFAATILLERCIDYNQLTLENWDGVWHFTDK
ncbi:adenylate/guanylate cyclase domain-containing protein [Thiotrichales bacterium 19S3-7]|nr:adenylate/guanylate cyclase domain-containing protein [Thiotrichales bacterium 19S3-7]